MISSLQQPYQRGPGGRHQDNPPILQALSESGGRFVPAGEPEKCARHAQSAARSRRSAMISAS